MIQDLLKDIDQTLIELLRDRLSLLKASDPPALEAQIANVAPLLAAAGIPESIWVSLVNSCDAALTTVTTSPVNNVTQRKITIIGGAGRMGKFFSEQLRAAGHEVSVLEAADWEYADKLLSHAELVIVSVPIERTVSAIKRAAKYMTPTAALCDITSLKSEPVKAMLLNHCGPVMGLHPMFGPNVKSLAEQKVVVCPGRNDEEFQWLLDFIKSQGGELILSSPEEHDELMVIIQATRHFSRFSLGVFLASEKIDIERSLSMSSPSYSQEIDIVKRLFAQSPHLCVDIMLATQERCQAIARLAHTESRLASLVAQKNRAALIQEFETTQSFFEEEVTNLLEDINYLELRIFSC